MHRHGFRKRALARGSFFHERFRRDSHPHNLAQISNAQISNAQIESRGKSPVAISPEMSTSPSGARPHDRAEPAAAAAEAGAEDTTRGWVGYPRKAGGPSAGRGGYPRGTEASPRSSPPRGSGMSSPAGIISPSEMTSPPSVALLSAKWRKEEESRLHELVQRHVGNDGAPKWREIAAGLHAHPVHSVWAWQSGLAVALRHTESRGRNHPPLTPPEPREVRGGPRPERT